MLHSIQGSANPARPLPAFTYTVFLGPSGGYASRCWVSQLDGSIRTVSLRQSLDGPQSLKWVLAGPLQKKLPDSCFMWVNYFPLKNVWKGQVKSAKFTFFSMAYKNVAVSVPCFSYAFLFQTAIFSLTLWHF